MNKFLPVVLIVLGVFQNGCYVIKQGAGQLRLRFGQVSITEAVLHEDNENYRQLLAAVSEARQFAIRDVLLKESDTYSGYFSTEEEGIAYIVTASKKSRLEPYTWWFPIVGSVPYKGFFNKKDALELEKELQSNGHDTWLFAAPAYSSLGWFKDPITTPMLKRGHYDLVESIIHEMTHTTVYINGEGDFNEQLASFVGQKGAVQYFQQHHILTESQLDQIKERRRLSSLFSQTARRYIPKLEEIYNESISYEEILRKRELVFSELVNEISVIYPHVPKKQWVFNNARMLQYRRYQSDSELFNEFWDASDQKWSGFWKLVYQYIEEKGWNS